MYTKEKLEQLGFKANRNPDLGCIDFEKKINDTVTLVLTPELDELFIWVQEGSDELGMRINLDTDNLEKAIELSSMVVDVE